MNGYFSKNIFFIIEKKENKTQIINVAFCLEDGNKMKLTEKLLKEQIAKRNAAIKERYPAKITSSEQLQKILKMILVNALSIVIN